MLTLAAATGAITTEGRVFAVLIQLTAIVIAARVFGALAKRIGQPGVVGEIAAGVVLGPSVLGRLEVAMGATDHAWSNAIFRPEVAPAMAILSQLGLILLMVLIGLEFDAGQLKRNGRSAALICAAGLAIPFAASWVIARWIHPHLEGVEKIPGVIGPVDAGSFALFLGTAVAITALPVLGRMMMELGTHRTRLAAIALGAAAGNDAVGWILLAAVSAAAQPELHSGNRALQVLGMFGMTVGLIAFLAVVVKPLLSRWADRSLARNRGELTVGGLAAIFALAFLAAAATSKIGIFAIFGAFVFGTVLSDQHALRDAISRHLSGIVGALFVPIFFTYTGLRTDVGTLSGGTMWIIAGAVFAVAIGGKLVGCAAAAKASGMSWPDSLCMGAMMNTRGLMELVVVNVGYDLKVIPKSMYCILVLMAFVTNFMTFPLLRRFARGTEFEGALRIGFR